MLPRRQRTIYAAAVVLTGVAVVQMLYPLLAILATGWLAPWERLWSPLLWGGMNHLVGLTVTWPLVGGGQGRAARFLRSAWVPALLALFAGRALYQFAGSEYAAIRILVPWQPGIREHWAYLLFLPLGLLLQEFADVAYLRTVDGETDKECNPWKDDVIPAVWRLRFYSHSRLREPTLCYLGCVVHEMR